MESINDSSERLMMPKKSTKLTLFEDLLQPSNPEKNSTLETAESDQYMGDSCPSDCESGISGTEHEQPFRVSDNGLIRVGNGEMIYGTIRRKLESNLSSYGFSNVQVEAIHRRDYSGVMSQAKLQTFCIYSKAMAVKCNGNANVKYAWYGTSKNEIAGILSNGFGFPTNSPQGVSLSAADHPMGSMQSSVADSEGMHHILLCRVILGKQEVISPSSGQEDPRFDEFDSGVDSLASPRKYVVWSSRMNTHLHPEFMVSFRASSSCRGRRPIPRPVRTPNSHWLPFATLIAALSKFLSPNAVDLVTKYYSQYKKKKIARYEMIQKVRNIAGDKLLMSIIKSNHRLKVKTSPSCRSLTATRPKTPKTSSARRSVRVGWNGNKLTISAYM